MFHGDTSNQNHPTSTHLSLSFITKPNRTQQHFCSSRFIQISSSSWSFPFELLSLVQVRERKIHVTPPLQFPNYHFDPPEVRVSQKNIKNPSYPSCEFEASSYKVAVPSPLWKYFTKHILAWICLFFLFFIFYNLSPVFKEIAFEGLFFTKSNYLLILSKGLLNLSFSLLTNRFKTFDSPWKKIHRSPSETHDLWALP